MYDADVVDEFARRLSERVRYLRSEGTALSRPSRTLTEAVIHELEQSAEELRVTGEELRTQGDQLLTAGRMIETERARFHRLFELAPDPCVVTDVHGTVIEANRAAGRLLAIDRTLLDRKPLPALLAADSVRDFRAALFRLARMELVGELRLHLQPKEGAPVPVQVRAAHLPPLLGEEARVVWAMRDESDQGRLDQARRDLARERASRAAAEAVSEHAAYLVRAAAELGADAADAERVAERAARLASEFADHAVVELAEGDPRGPEVPTDPVVEVADFPLSATRADAGRLRVFATSEESAERLRASAPLLEAFATYVGMALSNAKLLAEAERRGREAEESSRGRTRAMAGLSHELRTPLHSILGYSELLLDGVPEPLPEASVRFVKAIRGSAQHQAGLVDDILSLSKPGRTPQISLADCGVEEVVLECVAMVAERARARGVSVEAEVEEGLRAHTDRSKLSQVLINLLMNAVKFTPQGAVTVSARRDGSRMVVAVADTGDGIRAEELPHIFEPFWQGVASEQAGGEGAGLGLSLVRRLVEALGGEMAVQSQDGEGSTFTVMLPVVGPEAG